MGSSGTTEFGCEACYGEDPIAASNYYRQCPTDELVEDDPHFILRIKHCERCEQRFVSIFTEFVDWSGGEDAMYTTVMPVTEAEAAAISAAALSYRQIGELGRGRKHLRSDWPTGKPKRIGWHHSSFQVMPGF
ncbi:hypothetical protein [Nocardia sp. NPDC050406]|uniref:hypothetical protein n=1 Tax=Nocardia sp. NPDC050406 TaxID=3364318 RepID=UPI0037B34DBB